MTNSQVQYCFECDAMLCENLNHLDTRYRECYGMSMVENLKMLKAEGMDGFLKNQEARHRCQPAATRFLCMMENAIHTGT